MGKKFKLSILFLFVLLIAPNVSIAKLSPPEELTKMFANFSELEEKFESNEWDEALSSINDIANEYEVMKVKLINDVDKNTVQNFELFLDKLRESILKKDSKNTEKGYIILQNLFFKIIDIYDYEIHPLLVIIDKYIDEAMEAAENDDFQDVVSEMKEIKSFLKKAQTLLMQKGASADSIEQFNAKIVEIGKTAFSKNAEETKNKIKELKEMYASLLSPAK